MDEGRLLVNGLAMFFLTAGAGVPLLFVHGNLGSSLWWAKSMDLPGFKTVAVDLPNFGRSDPIPGWTTANADLADYAGYLAGFIEAAGMDRPVVVAHSLGGAVAQILVATRPDLVRALVLVDSGAPSGLFTPEERYPGIEAMRVNPAYLAMALKAVVPTMADDAWFNSLVADARRMAVPAWIGNAAALSRFDWRGKLRHFKKLVLVIWGRKDVVVSETMARETAAEFPNSSLIILETVGHSVMAEDPALWERTLLEFLVDIPK